MTTTSCGDASELAAILQHLVAGRAAAGWRPIEAPYVQTLRGAEPSIIERAVPQRQAEFATGRALLRDLLDLDVEIPRLASGAPALPPGFVGSLAHDRQIAVAAVAVSESVRAIGIDVEPTHDLDQGVASIIVRPDDVTPDALTAFVAKEAAYKAWSALGGEMLEHHDVRVIVDGGRYWADLGGELDVTGQIGRTSERVLAIVVIPAT